MKCPRDFNNCSHYLQPLLQNSSWVCYKAKCAEGKDLEFYNVKDMGLMTRKEFFERKKEEK